MRLALAALAIVMLPIVILARPASAEAPLSLEGSAAPSPWQRYPGWNKTRWDNYNTLANPNATPPAGKEIAIKEVTGDAAKGQQLAFDRNRGGGFLDIQGCRKVTECVYVGFDCGVSVRFGADCSAHPWHCAKNAGTPEYFFEELTNH